MDASDAPRQTSTVGIRVDAIPSLDCITKSYETAHHQGRPWIMTFANPSTSVFARRQPQLREILRHFDMVGPDGIGMVIAMRLLHRLSAARVSFDSTSLAPHVFAFASRHRISMALVGGFPGIAGTAKARIVEEYPDLHFVGIFDGYCSEQDLIAKVVSVRPGIVVVGMGTMLQDRFLLALVRSGWQGLGFTCGGYLDQLAVAGTQYYPVWVDRGHLRWLYRLVREPKRLWRRYLLEYPMFGIGLVKALLLGRGSK